MSNFEFLKNYDIKLYKSAIKIEKNVNTSPAAVGVYSTPFLQRVLEMLLSKIGLKFNSRKSYYYQLDTVYREGVIKFGFKDKIYDAYMLRNRIHDDIEDMERSEFFIAQQLHKKIYYIAKKMYEDFFTGPGKLDQVPSFMPVEIDTSADEVEMLEIPDFAEVIDIDYDYCIICGKPNHSSYSLCCHECNLVMDNANNFISIRNSFGKDKRFTKDDLIAYGIPEGYVNQFVNSMVRENMLSVRGRYITFNNMHLDDFLTKIDDYIAVCELITKFRQEKISASLIKQTREYKLGKNKHERFYQFYKIVNREIVKNFEKYLITTRGIWQALEYSTIEDKQLKRWYNLQLSNYRKGENNQSFLLLNDLMIKEYLNLKRQGILEEKIKQILNVTDVIYNFWKKYDRKFEKKIKQIKIDLITQAINKGWTHEKIIEFAGVTPKEYTDIIKVSNKHNDELSQIYNQEVTSRQNEFVKYLLNFDLEIACRKAKFTLDDFYDYYENGDVTSRFYIKSTEILMDKYLLERSRGKTIDEAIEKTGIKKLYLERWLTRSVYKDFKDRNVKVTVDIVLKGLKARKSLSEISHVSGVNIDTIKSWIFLGERDTLHKPLFVYYEEKIIPRKLDKFLKAVKTKSIRKSIDIAKLTENEINKYYALGQSGDERYTQFYEEFFKSKCATYLYNIGKGKSHKIAMRESWFSEKEYEDNKEELFGSLLTVNQHIVLESVKDKKTSAVAAGRANVSVDEIYEWYFRGKEGEEDYVNFYKLFHAIYVHPNINAIQKAFDNNKSHLDNLIKANRKEFTKRDVEIWVKNGLLDNNVLMLNKNEEDEDDEKTSSQFNANEMLREMGVEDYDKISLRKTSNSSSILSQSKTNAEKLKKEILKK